MEWTSEPGTIDDLIADAERAGYEGQTNRRLIRDWTQAGLLDYPRRRSAGKGHGSRPSLYSAHQRRLLLNLLHHRRNNGIPSLARIPVGIWMRWGEDYVPLRQARRAMGTWLGDGLVSQRIAVDIARELARQMDNSAATPAARAALRRVVRDLAYTGRVDSVRLERAVRDVFEPNAHRIHRAVGHPAAPMTAQGLVTLIQARLVARDRLVRGRVTDAEFETARSNCLALREEYAADQPRLAAAAPASDPDMYEAATDEREFIDCCLNLLTHLGMASLSADRARPQ